MFEVWKSIIPSDKINSSLDQWVWVSLPKFLCWTIWLERNKSIFKELAPSSGRATIKVQCLLCESISMLGINATDREEMDQSSCPSRSCC